MLQNVQNSQFFAGDLTDLKRTDLMHSLRGMNYTRHNSVTQHFHFLIFYESQL